MQLPYFYFPAITNQSNYVLDEDTSKHIVQVLRMQNGEQLQLTDGKGNLLTCIITDNHKKHCAVAEQKREHSPKSESNITIAISPLKNNSRFEWFLEKATELGVGSIVPIICKRTEKQHIKIERLQNILVSAMLQSRQAWLPKFAMPISFEKYLDTAQSEKKYIAHCADDNRKQPLISLINKKAGAHLLLIGPEGDFSNEEIELASAKGFESVSLGNTRLRTETAGIAAAVILTAMLQ